MKYKSVEGLNNFEKYGYQYERIARVNDFHLFSQTDIETPTIRYYELWKGKKIKQDGEIIRRAPVTSEWGQYGWTMRSLDELDRIAAKAEMTDEELTEMKIQIEDEGNF